MDLMERILRDDLSNWEGHWVTCDLVPHAAISHTIRTKVSFIILVCKLLFVSRNSVMASTSVMILVIRFLLLLTGNGNTLRLNETLLLV